MSTLTQPETPGQVREHERRVRQYRAVGLCLPCAVQVSYGHQHGFYAVRQPCQACAPLVRRFPQMVTNGWKTLPRGVVSVAGTERPSPTTLPDSQPHRTALSVARTASPEGVGRVGGQHGTWVRAADDALCLNSGQLAAVATIASLADPAGIVSVGAISLRRRSHYGRTRLLLTMLEATGFLVRVSSTDNVTVRKLTTPGGVVEHG